MNANLFRENAVGFTEIEILSHVLEFVPVKENPEEIASRLLYSMGSLKNIIEARPEQLKSVKGVSGKTANLLSTFLPMIRVYNKLLTDKPESIYNCMQAGKYCLSLLEGSRNEQFYIICLNAQCNVIGKRKISEGSLSEVNAYPRMIVETALTYNAHSVLLTHNHPGGTCAPSMEDIASTTKIQQVLKELGILVVDHIIVANNKSYSMVQHGDISYR